MTRGRGTGRRWLLVALVALALTAGPPLARAVPTRPVDIDAGTLLGRVQAAEDRPWSGLVETTGTLALPDADQFSDVAALFGGSTRMRVWWRDADHWRVDQLSTSGEQDLVRTGDRTVRWDYERLQARFGEEPSVRLPRAADLLPTELAARMLRGAGPDDVTRLPARRVADRTAPGLRLVPASPRTTIDHVDVWADADTGLPLRVEVYDASGRFLTSEAVDVDLATPSEARVSFTTPPGAGVERDDVLDIADAANQYAPLIAPQRAGGLEADGSNGAVGVYGTGPEQVVAIPLRDREADALRDQLGVTPGARQGATGTRVTVGPLGVLLTGAEGEGGLLVAGTVTPPTLHAVARDVIAGYQYVGVPQ
ncbi:sigma-E factor regulatory protein RseB domain-containing protein [Nocardioides acrostichi]|uniref:MucB/RseB N-terminal domain-containing protein n=1 Tax=Nocardioides acrostichi TaxID=2784339 RepID=A0A930UZK1_9ACTN|nr:hypothetical protein [Nocardioides acrostichi]MBF4163798.1 hypothetical protein [Nocardioides acrostichi]